MRVIGVDPGNLVTGFGVVERQARLTFIAAGTIRSHAPTRGPQRLASIYQGLIAVIDQHRPAAMSLERSFVAANVQSAFALGEARAMAMLAAAHRELRLYEYMPTEVKLSVAGFGRADKAQVQLMVRKTLTLDAEVELADDAADALAIALCHLFRMKMAAAIDIGAASARRKLKVAQGKP
ncbi:MAG: crossover junction endodeoxyribonuclease RuvC [Candidatus Binataceae bacterium]